MNKIEKMCVCGMMAVIIYQATPPCKPCFNKGAPDDLPAGERSMFVFTRAANVQVSSTVTSTSETII